MPEDITKGRIDRSLDAREDDRRIPLVEEIFHNIIKAIKTISIYKHNKDRFAEFVEPAYRSLEKFLKQYENLVVRVEPYSFKFLNAEVYKDTDQYSNISYRFFRDGVRRITFKQGLTLNEFLQFVLIVAGQSQVANQGEDTVSQLWLANLENIELTVVEGGISFTDSESGEDSAEKVEMDTIVNYLEKKLSTSTDESVGFARISAADIGLELESVEQLRGMKKKPDIVPAEVKQSIQEIFMSQDESVKVQRIKRILLALLKSDLNDMEMQDIVENLVLILDYLLLYDDLSKIVDFFREIERESQDRSLPVAITERIMQVRYRLQQELNADIRIDRIVQILKSRRIDNPEQIGYIFDLFNENTFTKLPQLIEQIEIQENLTSVVETLKNPRPHYEKVWIGLLSSKKINLVTTALDVVKEIDFEGKAEAIAPLLYSQVPQIVTKALEVVANYEDDRAESEINKFIEQRGVEFKDAIIKALPSFNEDLLANAGLKLLIDERFKLNDSQKMMILSRLADNISLPQVEAYFDSLFNEKGTLFTKSKVDEKKRMAIRAIMGSPSVATYQYLTRHLRNEQCSDSVKKEISLALEHIKHRLQGK
jgi:hypothetical protein